MLAQLQEIHRLLAKHGHDGQAAVVAEMIQLLPVKRDAFLRRLHSVDMWGGAGAVWEVGPMGADTRLFHDAVISLVNEMDAQGVGLERSHFIAETFGKWNADSV